MQKEVRCPNCNKLLLKAKALDVALQTGLEIEILCTRCKQIKRIK